MELGSRRGHLKTRRGETVWTTEKGRKTGKEGRSGGESGGKLNDLRKQKWKRK